MSIQFSDPRNGESTTVRDVSSPALNPWSYPTAAAIGPLGQLVVRHLTPKSEGSIGDVPLRVMDNEFFLSPRYRKAGWVMYEAMCRGEVYGIEEDLDALKRWEMLKQYNASGRVLPAQLRDDDKMFHPEVARRRKQGGVAHMPSVEEFKSQFPGFEFEDDSDDELTSKTYSKRKKGGA